MGNIAAFKKENNFKAKVIMTEAVEDIVNDIYKNYNSGLRRYLARHIYCVEDRDEIAQEVFIRLIRHPKLEELEPSMALLCKIASNIIKDRFRRQAVRKANAHVSMTAMDLPSSGFSPEQLVCSEEGIDVMRKVYNNLDKNCQRAFTLHRFVGLTYAQIAKEMGISKRTVCKHISNAVLKMREQIGEII